MPTFILGNFWLSRHMGGGSCRPDGDRTVLDNVYFQENMVHSACGAMVVNDDLCKNRVLCHSALIV
jgi:hypothetical protein